MNSKIQKSSICKAGWPWIESAPQLPQTMPDGSPWPLISIVTPSFNQGQYLEETIRSVLFQGYPNLEYIIIDGGSTDGSVEIIKKYEPWLTYWVSEKDDGQGHAINKGFARASGDIIAWLNSDDVYGMDMLRQAVVYLSQHPAAVIVYGQAEFVDNNSSVLSKYQTGKFRIPRFFYYDFIAQPTTVMRREAIDKIGGLNETLQFGLDYDLWLRLLNIGTLDYLPTLNAQYRVHPSSKSSTLQALRWRETTSILTSYFSSIDQLSVWQKWKNDAIGNAYWCASIEYAKLKQSVVAREYIDKALTYSPGNLERRLFAEIVVGRLASETKEEILDFVQYYFELIPDSVQAKQKARTLALARAEALLSLNIKTSSNEARRFGLSAVKRDPKWLFNRHLISRIIK